MPPLNVFLYPFIYLFMLISLISCSSGGSHHTQSTLQLNELSSTHWVNQIQAASVNEPTELWGIALSSQAKHLLQLAEKNNPQLHITALKVKQSMIDYEVSTGSNWPEVNVRGSTKNDQRLVDGEKAQHEQFTLGFSINWEVDIWQKFASEEKQQAWRFKAQQFELTAAYYSLQSQVLITYLEIIEQNNLLILNKKNIENQKRRLQMSIARLDNGLSTGIDIRNAKTNLFRLMESQRELTYKREQGKRRLNLLLGNYSEHDLKLQLTLPTLSSSIDALLPQDILLNRPDVKAAEADLIAAGYRWDVAKKKQLPKFSLNLNYEAKQERINNLFNIDYWLNSLTVSLVQPIFYRGILNKQAEKQQIQQQIQFQLYKTTLLKAWQQVEAAMHNEALLNKRQLLLEKAFHEAKEAETQTEYQYAVGVTNSFELLSAQRTRTAVEVDLMKLATDRLKNRIKLVLALGVPQSPTDYTYHAKS